LGLIFPREELPDVLCVKFGLPLDGFLVGLEIVTILTIGFVYMWLKGALDWE